MASLTIHTDAVRLRGFRYFWLKRVRGFDPFHHCAKCLVGNYIPFVHADMTVNHPVDISLEPGAIGYLCGVSSPYRWANNLHLAFEVMPGEAIQARTYTGDLVSILGARRIDFNGDEAKRRFSHLGPAFTTCRNFQFGASHFRE